MTHRFTPRRRFGQHFLHDSNVMQKIINAISPRSGENMVEIGPGQGAMTRHLLDRLGRLEVVEVDRDLINPLEDTCRKRGKLIVHNHNALRFDFSKLATRENKLRVVGNLPYNISTPLIFHLLEFSQHIQDMNFLLQKEVVQRLCAKSGTGSYGRLSVMVQYRCHTEHLLDVDPSAFHPVPRVDSALVRIVPFEKSAFTIHNETNFARLVNMVFNKRRKTLKNALRGLLSDDQIAAAGIDPGIRGETLNIGQLAVLSNCVTT